MLGNLHFARAQHGRAHLAIRCGQDNHLVQLGRFTPVGFIFAQGDTLFRHFFGQNKRPCPCAENSRRRTGIGCRGQDSKARASQPVWCQGIGFHRGDDHGAFISGFDACYIFGRKTTGRRFGGQQIVERSDDGLGGQCFAIVKGDPFTQRERPAQIIQPFPRFGQQRFDLSIKINLEQRFGCTPGRE